PSASSSSSASGSNSGSSTGTWDGSKGVLSVMRLAGAENTLRQAPQRTMPAAASICVSLTLNEVMQPGHWVKKELIGNDPNKKWAAALNASLLRERRTSYECQ